MNSVENNEIEIILNGVNVSGCEWLDNNKAGLLCGLDSLLYRVSYFSPCAGNPNCLYKQLQREKAQYDKLVKQNKSLQTSLQELQEALERADEDIKAECTRCSTIISLDDELEECKALNKKFVKDINVLRKTLKEIEEIAKASIYTPSCFEDPDCPKNGGAGFDNHCDEYCPILIINKILEKTKEVGNERQI